VRPLLVVVVATQTFFDTYEQAIVSRNVMMVHCASRPELVRLAERGGQTLD